MILLLPSKANVGDPNPKNFPLFSTFNKSKRKLQRREKKQDERKQKLPKGKKNMKVGNHEASQQVDFVWFSRQTSRARGFVVWKPVQRKERK